MKTRSKKNTILKEILKEKQELKLLMKSTLEEKRNEISFSRCSQYSTRKF